jgi:hypothetical protein
MALRLVDLRVGITNTFHVCSQENKSGSKYLNSGIEGSTADDLSDAGCIEARVAERGKSKNQHY